MKRTYSKTWNQGDRGFGLAVAGILLWFALILAVNVAIICVAIHFILKYW